MKCLPCLEDFFQKRRDNCYVRACQIYEWAMIQNEKGRSIFLTKFVTIAQAMSANNGTDQF